MLCSGKSSDLLFPVFTIYHPASQPLDMICPKFYFPDCFPTDAFKPI